MVPPERRRVGLVFQDLALFPHLSVRDNLSFAGANGDELAEVAGAIRAARREFRGLESLGHIVTCGRESAA